VSQGRIQAGAGISATVRAECGEEIIMLFSLKQSCHPKTAIAVAPLARKQVTGIG